MNKWDASLDSLTAACPFQLSPNGTELACTTLPEAWGLAHYNGRVYVAQFLSTSIVAETFTGSGVAVLRASNLELITTLKPPQTLARVTQDADSGYSGVAISPTGMLYVADQAWWWPTFAPGASYVPGPVNATASPIINGTWAFDRVLMHQV